MVTERRSLTLSLPEVDYQALRAWAARERTAEPEILRRALMLLAYLRSEQARGSTVTVRTPAGEDDLVLVPLAPRPGEAWRF